MVAGPLSFLGSIAPTSMPKTYRQAVLTRQVQPQAPVAGRPLALARPTLPPAKIANPDVCYEQFIKRFDSAVGHPDPKTRLELLLFYNASIAPFLDIEEAALQMLAVKLGHIYLTPGYPIAFNITTNLSGQSTADYDSVYHVQKVKVDSVFGLVAYKLEPQDNTKKSILLFRGTASLFKRDILSRQNLPSGARADFDSLGVGSKAFASSKDELQSWVNEILEESRSLIIVGHSLGGAYAARLLASLSADQQGRVSMLSFNAPGVDEETASQIYPGLQNVRVVLHDYDPVCMAGERHPTGLMIRTRDLIQVRQQRNIPHSIPQFAVRQLRGEAPQFTLGDSASICNRRWVEGIRLAVSWSAERRLRV